MSDTAAPKATPRRRFAPVPIETTYERYRKGMPAGEPTPSPSPRSPSPPRRPRAPTNAREPEKKRFAPQLIESSRRSRRLGDVGPATKPVDKTDITPYYNHIYVPKTKKKHRKRESLARRESCDDETADHVFEILAREAEKRLFDDALAAFPNSRARAGGAEHFAMREGSDDDSTEAQSRGQTGPGPHTRTARRSRRDSYTEELGWAVREMQEHAGQLSKVRTGSTGPSAAGPSGLAGAEGAEAFRKHTHNERISTLELDQMSIDSPPTDPIWTTTGRRSTRDSFHPIGESHMALISEEPRPRSASSDAYRGIPAYARKLREAEGDLEEEDEEELMRHNEQSVPRPIGDTGMPYIPTGPSGKPELPDEGFRGRNPFAGYRNRDLFAERELHKLRRKSPPMLGKDLVFPKCLSPQQTQSEPEFLWTKSRAKEESHRDATGKNGLWNGYCYAREQGEALAPIDRPVMLATPFPPSSPGDPFAQAFSSSAPDMVSDEPADFREFREQREEREAREIRGASTHLFAQAVHSMPSSTLYAGGGLGRGGSMAQRLEQRHGGLGNHNGLHILMSLDQRLKEEAEKAELEEKIAAEFTDSFVTQVYNYLSLGYPAMARSYDDELSKISRIPLKVLEDGDENAMDVISKSKGHIALDEDDDGPPKQVDHSDCPRWRALKLYIFEWARQHPDLNSISPQAWGVQERRGSWGV